MNIRPVVSLSIAFVLGAVSLPQAEAANYYWDGGTTNIAGNGDGASAGGTGTWSTAISNWDVGNGVAHSVWVDGNTANFGGTGGTVTLGTAISNGIVLAGSSAYTIATGAFQLTLTGGVTASTAFVDTISGTGALALSGGGTHTFALTGSALNISSAITGSDAITLTGGNLGLSGTNTGYTGKVTVTGGTLFVNSDSSLGAVPATFVADSLTLNGGALTAGVPNGVANNYFNATPTISANRGITLGSSGGTFNIGYGGSGYATINSVISGTGSLTKTDTGDLILQGANTFSGGLIVNAGRVAISSDAALGAVPAGSSPRNLPERISR